MSSPVGRTTSRPSKNCRVTPVLKSAGAAGVVGYIASSCGLRETCRVWWIEQSPGFYSRMQISCDHSGFDNGNEIHRIDLENPVQSSHSNDDAAGNRYRSAGIPHATASGYERNPFCIGQDNDPGNFRSCPRKHHHIRWMKSFRRIRAVLPNGLGVCQNIRTTHNGAQFVGEIGNLHGEIIKAQPVMDGREGLSRRRTEGHETEKTEEFVVSCV